MTWASIAEITDAVAGTTAVTGFLATVDRRPDAVALRRRTPQGEEQEWTWAEVADRVARAAAGLAAAGVRPGDRVLLLMRNRPEFHWFDLAVQLRRAVPVSIYNSSSPEEIQYLAHHAEAGVAIVEDAGFAERVLAVHDELPLLRACYVIEPPIPTGGIVRPAADLLEGDPADLRALAAAVEPGDLATLIYTSGTTGPPKGVMIDQANVVYTVEQLRRCIELDVLDGLRVVSYLPMAHIAERMVSHYQWMIGGYEVTTCPDPSRIAEFLRAVRPEILFGVPRVWEKLRAGIVAALAADAERAARVEEGVALALTIAQARRDGTATTEQLETWAFLDAVAFAPIRTAAGLDALRYAITGAAPIPRTVLEWFNAIGVPLSEIYGMSESCGPMTWDAHDIRPGTVGRAIPGCEVRLGDDGEVLCRGGNVFRGYFRSPEQTATTVVDGWLHSGDIGVLDDDGYLRIVDRKKELIITSGGKNISPANLEAALRTIPLVGQACAMGDNRKYVVALLVLDPEYAPVWAATHGLAGLSLDDLARHPDVVAAVAADVAAVNAQFASVEQIKRFALLGEEWLPDSDVLTPTAKLKRRGIAQRYRHVVDELYDQAE
jgi:long-chain acyl-CoA synthetase